MPDGSLIYSSALVTLKDSTQGEGSREEKKVSDSTGWQTKTCCGAPIAKVPTHHREVLETPWEANQGRTTKGPRTSLRGQ